MLRETEPGLITFYDIWPGNGASLFLEPWSSELAQGQSTAETDPLDSHSVQPMSIHFLAMWPLTFWTHIRSSRVNLESVA